MKHLKAPLDQPALFTDDGEPAAAPAAVRVALPVVPAPAPGPSLLPFADRVLVLDTETTGLDAATDRVVEVAVVELDLRTRAVRGQSWLVDPGIPIPAESSAVHHLTDEDVKGQPDLATVLAEASATFLPDGALIAAHNAPFDAAFLPDAWKPTLCTHRLARKLWPELPKTTNQFLRYHFRLEVPEAKGLAAHRALADAYVTARVLLRELDEALGRPEVSAGWDGAEALLAWVRRPILQSTCRFGAKHYGKAWSEVPRDYLAWMLREVKDLDEDTRFTLNHLLGRSEAPQGSPF